LLKAALIAVVIAALPSTALGVASPGRVPVRACTSAVWENLGKNWRQDPGTILVGPVAFLSFEPSTITSTPASSFAPTNGLYRGQKTLVAVANNVTVRLVVPRTELQRLRLLYNPAVWNQDNLYPLAKGDVATVFHGCGTYGGTKGLYNGSFLVAGQQCASVDIYVGQQRKPLTARLPFGHVCPASVKPT
jgi:hypothetical protein